MVLCELCSDLCVTRILLVDNGRIPGAGMSNTMLWVKGCHFWDMINLRLLFVAHQRKDLGAGTRSLSNEETELRVKGCRRRVTINLRLLFMDHQRKDLGAGKRSLRNEETKLRVKGHRCRDMINLRLLFVAH